jgi:hypothetical protein
MMRLQSASAPELHGEKHGWMGVQRIALIVQRVAADFEPPNAMLPCRLNARNIVVEELES